MCITFDQIFKFDIRKKNEEPVTIFSEKLTDEFSNAGLYMGTILSNNKFAVNSRNKGVYIIDFDGNIIEHIDTESDLEDNFVWCSFLSSDNLLWLGLNSGFSSININSPFQIWNKKTGLNQTINDIIRFEGVIYLATMNGLFYINPNTNKFEQNIIIEIPGTYKSQWRFVPFFDKKLNKNRLLLAGTSNLYEISNFKIINLKNVSNQYNLIKSNIFENTFYSITANFVEAFKIENSTITTLGTISLKGILKYCNQEKNGNLWIGSTNDGIFRLEISKNDVIDTSKYKKSGIFLNTKVTAFDTTNGLPDLVQIRAFFYKDFIFLGTNKGIYFYNETKNIIEKDTTLGSKFKNPKFKVIDIACDSLSNIYVLSGSKIYKFYPYQRSFIIDSTTFNQFEKKSKDLIYIENSKNIWFGGVNNLIHYNPQIPIDTISNFNCLIRKVIINNDSTIFYGNFYSEKLTNGYIFDIIQPKNLIPQIDYKYNSITFLYSSPYFINNEETQYSYILVGYQNEWSNWTTETKKEFTNLKEGKYIFRVKAKNIFNKESSISEYIFYIKTPWYRTFIAYFFYILITILLLILIVKIYSRKLQKEKIKLENIVKQRTKEIQLKNIDLQNQKEEILAQSEELEKINFELQKLSVIAQETDNAIIITDTQGNFEWLNHGFEKLYGYSLKEFKLLYTNLLSSSSNSNIKNILNSCLVTKQSANYESFMLSKNNDKIWVQSTITPIINKDNQITKFIIIDSDITKQKIAEQEILQKKEEITQQNTILENQNIILIQQKEEIEAQRYDIEQKNIEIIQQNEQLTSSITYAKTIQQAILPDINLINQYFDNFIIYLPKDIVSGDFYWFHKAEKYFLFAVIDCTGHGVPGAFMSMIGYTLLNDIVYLNIINSTSEITKELNKKIIKLLKQQNSYNNDGMDVCLVKIEPKEDYNIITFTGAKRDLFIYDSNLSVINRIKGSRKTIGGINYKFENKEFEEIVLSLTKNSILYLTTDGYFDQNNIERKSFGSSNFVNLLDKIAKLSMQEQKNILEKKLNDWKSNELQRDDITIVGIRL